VAKIVARIRGGIGNQLFIYAAARRLALVSDAELVLDAASGFAYDTQYNQRYQLEHFHIPCRTATAAERLEPFSRARRYLKRRANMFRPIEKQTYHQQQRIDYDPRLLQLQLHGTLYLEGYWQSEDYFKDVEATIRQDLRIRAPSDDANQTLVGHIRSHAAVAVHVRFFDEPQTSGIDNAPGDYYQRAIVDLDRRVPGAHYYVFSDRPEAARSRVPLPDRRLTLVSHNQGDSLAYADLWLMTQCRHFIIANSTFSWWGAWLAEHPDKQVIAPGFEKRNGKTSWGFGGLLPERWTKL